MAIERRKARSRAVGLSIFVLAIMLVTVLMILTVMQQASPRPRLIFLTEGAIDHVVASQGLILRDETVMQAPVSGLLKPTATEGSRTASGQTLALIIPEDKEEQLRQLQKAENDLVDLQMELIESGQGPGAQAIYDESAVSLGAIANLIRRDVSQEDLSNLSAYSASVSVILEQRTSQLMQVDFRDLRLEELQQVHAQLERSLGLEAGTLICPSPGTVSFKLDGLEETLPLEKGQTLDLGDYRRYLEQAESRSHGEQPVQEGQPVLRITSGHHHQLVFFLPGVDAATLITGEAYDIRLPTLGQTIRSARLLRSESRDDGALVVLSSDRMVERLADRRSVEAKIVVDQTHGLKVSQSALFDRDENRGEATLLMVSGGYTRQSRVAILDQDRDHAIIKALPDQEHRAIASSVIVVNPESIEEGEFIGN